MDGKDARTRRRAALTALVFWTGLLALSSGQVRSPVQSNGGAAATPQIVADQRAQIDRAYDLARRATSLADVISGRWSSGSP